MFTLTRTSDPTFYRCLSSKHAAEMLRADLWLRDGGPSDYVVAPGRAPRSTTYAGHLPDGSSIQRHSAGGIFPYVIVARESSFGLLWGVINPGDLDPFAWVFSFAEALEDAVEALRLRHERESLIGAHRAKVEAIVEMVAYSRTSDSRVVHGRWVFTQWEWDEERTEWAAILTAGTAL